MNKSVGIVTRTKNRAVLLKRALESVTKQSYNNWYLVVVNDGGACEPVDNLIKSYKKQFGDRIQVVHNPISVGMEAASNIGLNLLDTDYAIIHDDDDTWSPEFLSRMIKILIKEQQVLPNIQGIVCYTNRVIETVNGNLVTIEYTEPFNHWIPAGLISLDRMLFENMFPPISFIFSLKICKELGGFNEMLPVLGDWDFHIRFLLKNDIWVLPEPMAFYHHRPSADGVLGNSVIAGLDKHRLYRSLLTNKWLRDDLNGNGNGLGIYCNQREHIEHLLKNSWGANEHFREINDRFLEVKENIEENKHKLNWLIHSTGPIEKFFSILRHFGITQGLKRIGRVLTSWK